MISVENISKSFGGNRLFENTGFRLNRRERIGLVGRNGHGKTTLFKMIAGKEGYDSGSIIVPQNYKIGYVKQHIDFKEHTILAEGIRGLNEDEKDCHWKVEKILAGLGFTQEDMYRNPHEFSGGFQVRLNLAKVLVSEPDLLLLDEPTNYLDITSIRWIEKFLNNWHREVLLITHDRSFMDKVVTDTVGIHRKKMRKIKGNTEKYYSQIAKEEKIYEKTRLNDEKKRKEVELFISRFRAKARLANMVQSRIKTLGKKEKKEKLENLKNLDFSFRSKSIQCRYLMRVENLTFGYPDEKPLIENLNFNMEANDRICVVGKNGKGKTTLLKNFAGILTPQQGNIIYNPNVGIGFYEQSNVSSLINERTVSEEILYSDKGTDLQSARNIAGAMMFEGDAALKKIGVLSGGEKARVMLGKLLATPCNLLLLDEPTNHLDMDSCDALLAAIDNFDGAVIIVTHNEMFLNAIARKLIIFRNEKAFLFAGTYSDFLEQGGWNDDDPVGKKKTPVNEKENPLLKMNKKELRKRRSEILTEKIKRIHPKKRRIAKLEKEIDIAEKKSALLNKELIEAYQTGSGTKIAELSQAVHTCQTLIDKRFAEFEKLTEQLEKEDKIFTKRIAQLEKMTSL